MSWPAFRRALLQREAAPLQHRGHVFTAIHIVKARRAVHDFKGPGLQFHPVRLTVRAEVPLLGFNRSLQIDRAVAILKRHGVLRETGTDERLHAIRRPPDEKPGHHKALFRGGEAGRKAPFPRPAAPRYRRFRDRETRRIRLRIEEPQALSLAPRRSRST